MSASAIRRAPIPRRSSQSCARWACDGRARGDDHGRHGGDGRCRRARGRARRARRRAGRRARPRLSTSTRRGCPKRAQRGRRHARRRACAARGARARRSRLCPPARPRSRRPPQARLSARAAFARRPRPPSAPPILRAGSNDVNRTTRALPSGVEQRAAPARPRAASRIAASTACVAPSALASAARASTSSSLASGAARAPRRSVSLRIAPYRVMMVSESASRRCDPVLGAPDAALDSGQRLSGRGAYACSACGRSGRGQLRHGSPPARRRICRWGGAAGDARAGRPERR
ncbi:putative dTMP kinase [Burkholderia pseudomallei MSHR7334]|nr:putative dTMP kinase [Burkholderia pseudomallei MSHR7334]